MKTFAVVCAPDAISDEHMKLIKAKVEECIGLPTIVLGDGLRIELLHVHEKSDG